MREILLGIGNVLDNRKRCETSADVHPQRSIATEQGLYLMPSGQDSLPHNPTLEEKA
jgi:hypothetical protein